MSQDDPDNRATVEAAAVLKLCLHRAGHDMTKRDAYLMAGDVIGAWVRNRTCHWATRRGTPPFGKPDAMTEGFALAALPMIADALPDFPWGKTMGELTREEAAQLFATAHEAIEARRVHTLEDPNDYQVGA